MFYAKHRGGYKPDMRQLLLVSTLLALAAPVAAAPADPVSVGHFETWTGTTGMVVAAPHGGFDLHSDAVARQVALATGAGYVLASGYRTKDHPWNVNRPTEGVGLKAEDERHTPEAKAIYLAYAEQVARQCPKLYVEIHGNSRPESADAIEVATLNVPDAAARALQAEFRRRVDALDGAYPRFDLKIEPFDAIHFRAGGAKRFGVFNRVPRVVHLELPGAMRFDEPTRTRYAWVIAQSLEAMVRSLK